MTVDHPVTLGDLRLSLFPGESLPDTRPATVADLLSPEIRSLVIEGLRAEGVLVVEKVDGEWSFAVLTTFDDFAHLVVASHHGMDELQAAVEFLAESLAESAR